MDILLSKVTQQAMNYAIRSGVTLTASYAIKQSARLLQSVPKSNHHDRLHDLQQRLQGKIRIISPAIDMIELIAARGNTSLESAVALTKELRWEIQSFGQRMASVATAEEAARRTNRSAHGEAKSEVEIKLVISNMEKLLERIEDAVPLINLAITTSGASLSSRLPPTVSPSRLLQASTLLNAGDMQYCLTPDEAVQIGPSFTLTVYMLFSGHVRPHDEASVRETTWKEVMHKARVKLRRVPMRLLQTQQRQVSQTDSTDSPHAVDDSLALQIPDTASVDEYAYQMMLIEDLNDDRFHTTENEEIQPGPFDDVEQAGIRETFPVYQIGKIFYADTGKVLNIGSEESNSPVLLLKRDLNARPPRSIISKDELGNGDETDPLMAGNPSVPVQATTGAGPWALPPGLDPDWIALEIYNEDEESEGEPESEGLSPKTHHSLHSSSADPQLAASMAQLKINGDQSPSPITPSNSDPIQNPYSIATTRPPSWMSNVQTSLSLLEILLRLLALSEYLQTSHLSANDQWLNFFLEESKATGAAGDENARQRVRADARRRVGFDPYDESPVKRRGEDYQYQAGSVNGQGWQSRPDSPRWSSPDASRLHGRGAGWTTPSMQTRSMTGFSDSKSPSPSSPAQGTDRRDWLRRREDTTSSPLRPHVEDTDEGIGTSPGSGAVEAEPT